MAATSLTKLHDDILISIISWIAPSDIISLRKTCTQLYDLTHTRIVWTNACVRCILAQGYPFKYASLDSLSIVDLEKSTLDAYRLGRRWCSRRLRPRSTGNYDGLFSSAISDVRFVPGHGDKWIVTICKSVWSVLTLWDVSEIAGHPPQAHKKGEWSPKGGIFKNFCLNGDPTSIATLAIALLYKGTSMLYILSIRKETVPFHMVTSFPTHFTPVTLQGDIVVLSDEGSQISIWNWRTNKHATLLYPEELKFTHSQPCYQVLLCPSLNSILVVRNQSISLFSYPELGASNEPAMTYSPIAQHDFGWIDGITATLVQPVSTSSCAMPSDEPLHTISLLLRRKNADPWYSDTHSIEHYILLPNPTYDPEATRSPLQEPTGGTQTEAKSPHHLPYIFPPFLRSQISSLRGSLGRLLHSSNIILGRNGTAVWINPQDYAAGGLYFDVDDAPFHIAARSSERLMAALFHGPMSRCDRATEGGVDGDVNRVDEWTLCVNDMNNWTAMDYDENAGRIVIGSASGDLTMVVL
ncbi:hypothetical protein APHAL10511_005494 [Amanita phalloides]|nr:hypothetical protein APHAL10511_005494 [Amanita phalloides]